MIKILFVYLLALFTGGASALDATAPSERKFHFVVPTQHPTHVPNRAAPFKFEFRNAPFNRMKDLLRSCADVLPDFKAKPPVLYIILGKEDVYMAERKGLAAEARRQFNEIYPDVELKIKFRVVKTRINHEFFYRQDKRNIEKLKATATSDEDREKIAEMERANEEAYEQTKNRFETSADTGRNVKAGFAITRAFVIAATRGVQTAPAMMLGGVPLASSIGLIVADFAAEYFLVVKSQKMQRFFAKTFVKTKSAKINAFASNATNMAWNLTLFSVGRPMLMQVIQHIAEPMMVDLPTWATVGGILQWSIPGALVFTIFNKGYNKLRDKGWLSSSQIDVALQAPGVLDSINAVVNSNPEWYWLRPFINLPQMAFYAVVGGLGAVAKRRADRILAIDSSIVDWETDIHPEQLTDASYLVDNDEDFARGLKAIKESGLVPNTCGDLIMKDSIPLPSAEDDPAPAKTDATTAEANAS